jgi:aspartyl protease
MTRVLCLFLILIAFAAPAATAGELETLVDRHVAWRGGAAYEGLQSIRLHAEFKAGGLIGVTDEWRERAGRSRDVYELGPVKGSSAVAADSWSESGGVLDDMSAASVTEARRALALEFGDALRARGGATVRLLDPETRDGGAWSVLRVSFGDADTYDAFLDPATGALHGWRITEDRRTRFVRLSDWRMVDGVRMAFAREETTDNAAATISVAVKTISLNERIDPAIYGRPKAHRIATFAGGATSTGPIKFDFFNGNRIYIPAVINGRAVKVLLDSGADITVLDKGFAEQAGIGFTGRAVMAGSGGEADAHFASDVVVQIGAMRLENRNVAVADMADVSKRLGIPLPVVIGEDVFKQLIVEIDFDRAEITFHEPSAFRPPAGAITVPVTESESVRSVAVQIEGHEPIQVDFDLGNGSYFSVDPAFWQKHRMLEERPHSTILGGAVGGAREETVGLLKTVRFAGIDFKDVPTTFTTPAEGRAAVDSERQPGNIGLSILARFRLITDYAHDRLYLVPYRDAATRPFRKDRAGLQTVLEGDRLKVTFASPGSPAQAAGWKVGEEITAIDGRPVTAAFHGSDLSRWRFGAAGKAVKLTMTDGSKRTLVLRDYF